MTWIAKPRFSPRGGEACSSLPDLVTNPQGPVVLWIGWGSKIRTSITRSRTERPTVKRIPVAGLFYMSSHCPGLSSGGRIRTCDVLLMRQASYRTALPRRDLAHEGARRYTSGMAKNRERGELMEFLFVLLCQTAMTTVVAVIFYVLVKLYWM